MKTKYKSYLVDATKKGFKRDTFQYSGTSIEKVKSQLQRRGYTVHNIKVHHTMKRTYI